MSGEVVLMINGREFELAYGDGQDVDQLVRETQDRLIGIVGTDEPSREVFQIRNDDSSGPIELFVNAANVAYASVYRRTAYEPYSGFAQR